MQHSSSVADDFATPGGRTKLVGYNVSAGGAACVVNFRENNVSGDILVQVKVAANDSKTDLFGSGIDCNGPIFVEYSSGTPANVTVFWE